MLRLIKISGMALALAGGLLYDPSPAAAHCDAVDGPVVKAAQRALETADVRPALVWVRPADEAEIKAAFARTLAVRKLDKAARELADTWFFETLVRVHRQGEGEPYTGLKPAGTAAPGIVAADRSIEQGSVDQLAKGTAEHIARAVREKFEQVQKLKAHAPGDVAAGRRYVQAYVEYIHFVETVHELAAGGHGEAHK